LLSQYDGGKGVIACHTWEKEAIVMHFEAEILVTGGAGFLGSHLCERLLAQGSDVICVDNFFTGARRNIQHLLDHKRFELIRHDVTFPLYIEVDQTGRSPRPGVAKRVAGPFRP
jgi:nucleoside-diphosphate-sugar epimerase